MIDHDEIIKRETETVKIFPIFSKSYTAFGETK